MQKDLSTKAVIIFLKRKIIIVCALLAIIFAGAFYLLYLHSDPAVKIFYSDISITEKESGRDDAERLHYLENFFESLESNNIDKIKEVMSFSGDDKKGEPGIANSRTVQSVIFLSGQKMVYIAKGTEAPVTQEGYVVYNYGNIFSR